MNSPLYAQCPVGCMWEKEKMKWKCIKVNIWAVSPLHRKPIATVAEREEVRAVVWEAHVLTEPFHFEVRVICACTQNLSLNLPSQTPVALHVFSAFSDPVWQLNKLSPPPLRLYISSRLSIARLYLPFVIQPLLVTEHRVKWSLVSFRQHKFFTCIFI